MKTILWIENKPDRDQVAAILINNGYTVSLARTDKNPDLPTSERIGLEVRDDNELKTRPSQS